MNSNQNSNISLTELEEQVRQQMQARGAVRKVVSTSELRKCVYEGQHPHQNRPAAAVGGGLLNSFKRFNEDKRRRA